MVGNAFNPLAEDVELDVTPATTTVYGYVRDSKEFPVEGVTVNVNGVEAVSDLHGRYIAEYVASANNTRGSTANRNTIAVATDHEGNQTTESIVAFAANDRIPVDVDLGGVGTSASISGTVTASGSGAPVAGVVVEVDYPDDVDANGDPIGFVAPENAATRGANSGKLVTGADGTYTVVVVAQEVGDLVSLRVTKAGMSFVPNPIPGLPAHAGSDISGFDFTAFLHARITGRVRGTDGNAMGGVKITAVSAAGGTGDDVSSTSNARGTFVLSVPFGVYDIEASADNHIFKYPNDNQTVSVTAGQTLNFGPDHGEVGWRQ